MIENYTMTSISTTPTLALILGGARSGKSTFAEQLAVSAHARVTYLASAQAFDDEMRARIAKHQAERPAHWRTVECPYDPAGALRAHAGETDCFLLDCLTLLVSNLLLRDETAPDAPVHEAIADLLTAQRESGACLICVSNEVGLGLVPDNPLGRRYRDLLGRVNQQVAAAADQVYFLVAGIPLEVKSLACSPFTRKECPSHE
jgi:adenosylcobinamide kinase/adenosylcobinamide-phosphate guanylyltransferase